MSTPSGDEQGWFPYAFGLIQTSLLGLVGYVSKLLRDLRKDQSEIRKDVADVKTEQVKQGVELKMSREEHNRRLTDLEHKQDK